MRHLTRRLMAFSILVAGTVCVAAPASAQAGGQQTPPSQRYVTVTTFDVPYQDRAKVLPFIREYVIPAMQLNPKTINFRVMLHNWGSDASQVALVSEFASFADIESECGKPCDDYYAQHPNPKEGDPKFAAFTEASNLFSRYYANHRDEIYNAGMGTAKVEGRMVGTVGPAPSGGE